MSDGTLRARIATLPKFVVKTDETNGRIIVTDPLTVKNAINDPLPVRISQLLDVNTSLIEDGATLVYNSNTEFYEVKLLDKLGDLDTLTVTNTFSVYSLLANGSSGSPGMFLTSNGTSVYWSSDVDLVANNALFLNGKPEEYYTNATSLVTGTLNANLLPIIDGGTY
jgi:hypothetical protein